LNREYCPEGTRKNAKGRGEKKVFVGISMKYGLLYPLSFILHFPIFAFFREPSGQYSRFKSEEK
jgi:hypothetical protein